MPSMLMESRFFLSLDIVFSVFLLTSLPTHSVAKKTDPNEALAEVKTKKQRQVLHRLSYGIKVLRSSISWNFPH